jgi:hypothetical protein
MKCQAGRKGCGNHLGVNVHTGNLRTGSKLLSRKPRDDSGSAGKVENAIRLREAHPL